MASVSQLRSAARSALIASRPRRCLTIPPLGKHLSIGYAQRSMMIAYLLRSGAERSLVLLLPGQSAADPADRWMHLRMHVHPGGARFLTSPRCRRRGRIVWDAAPLGREP